jgi:hypothetical protein
LSTAMQVGLAAKMAIFAGSGMPRVLRRLPRGESLPRRLIASRSLLADSPPHFFPVLSCIMDIDSSD